MCFLPFTGGSGWVQANKASLATVVDTARNVFLPNVEAIRNHFVTEGREGVLESEDPDQFLRTYFRSVKDFRSPGIIAAHVGMPVHRLVGRRWEMLINGTKVTSQKGESVKPYSYIKEVAKVLAEDLFNDTSALDELCAAPEPPTPRKRKAAPRPRTPRAAKKTRD